MCLMSRMSIDQQILVLTQDFLPDGKAINGFLVGVALANSDMPLARKVVEILMLAAGGVDSARLMAHVDQLAASLKDLGESR